MTWFEVEQVDEFVQSLERHLDQWLFTRRDMQRILKELNLIDRKLRTVVSPKNYPAGIPAFDLIIEDLQQRMDACRSSIRERLMI